MKTIYQFRIKKDAATYFNVSPTGVITTSASPQNLQNSIVDWDTLEMQYMRHKVFHGVFRQIAPESVRFVNGGAEILRYVYNTMGGSEANCQLEVLKLRSRDQLYYAFFTCDIDFSESINELLYIDVKLNKGGIAAILNAFDTTVFNVEIPPPDGVDNDLKYLWLDGVLLQGSYNYNTFVDPDSAFLPAWSTPVDINDFSGDTLEQALGIDFLTQEGTFGVGTASTSFQGTDVPGGTFSEAVIFEADIACTVTFTIPLKFKYTADSLNARNTKLELWARVYTTPWGSSVGTRLWNDSAFRAAGATSDTFDETFSFTHVFASGESLVLAWNFIRDGAWDGINQLKVFMSTEERNITAAYSFRNAATPCRSIRHMGMFKRLTQLLCNSVTPAITCTAVSSLLSTDVYPGPEVFNLSPYNTFFTCGDALRQLYKDAAGNDSDPAIQTTIKEFVNDGFLSLCGGLGIEKDGAGNDTLVFEHLSHFYQKDVLIKDLGSNITNWRKYPYTEYLANNLKTGFKDQTYDEVNGRFEFNTQMNWQTSVIRTQKDLDYTSPYRHDCYGMEYARANLAGKLTTDSSSDNDTFKAQSNGNDLAAPSLTPFPKQLDRAHAITAGLPADVAASVFNVPFTNKRQLSRLLPFLKSSYHILVDPVLKFQTASKNGKLESSMYTGPVVRESDNMDLRSTGGDILFIPEVFEFVAEAPIDLDEIMGTTPYGVFGHHIKKRGVDIYLEGFALDVGIEPGTNKAYNFKLLCSPKTPPPANL